MSTEAGLECGRWEAPPSPRQIVLSVLTSAIFREKQLIVSLLGPVEPQLNAPATRTCHWIKTIKEQRAPLQRLPFDEGTIIQPIAASRAPQGSTFWGKHC